MMRYVVDEEHGLELVLTGHSGRSYPLHNHVSMDLAGLVTEGWIRMTIAGEERFYKPGDSFVIHAYVPHSIECVQPYSLMVLCVKSREKRTAGKFVELSERIAQCPEQSLSVDEMAKIAYLSKYQMIRSFKREIGLTPHRFLLQNRVRKAQKLVRQQEDLTKVAYDLGFCDQSHFIRSFEKVVGLSPSEYREAVSEGTFAGRNLASAEEALAVLIQCRDEFCKQI